MIIYTSNLSYWVIALNIFSDIQCYKAVTWVTKFLHWLKPYGVYYNVRRKSNFNKKKSNIIDIVL